MWTAHMRCFYCIVHLLVMMRSNFWKERTKLSSLSRSQYYTIPLQIAATARICAVGRQAFVCPASPQVCVIQVDLPKNDMFLIPVKSHYQCLPARQLALQMHLSFIRSNRLFNNVVNNSACRISWATKSTLRTELPSKRSFLKGSLPFAKSNLPGAVEKRGKFSGPKWSQFLGSLNISMIACMRQASRKFLSS